MANDLHQYLFHQGTDYQSYRYLGCHKETRNGIEGFAFRVWAVNAKSVSVAGDFNDWNTDRDKCQKLNGEGIWEAFIPNAKVYDNYKFCITTPGGGTVFKADPYAFHSQTAGESASKVYGLPEYCWTDKSYQNFKDSVDIVKQPVNIYECHPGSWKKYPDGNYYSYRALADELVPYIKGMGYTHIEFMGIAEYPYDGSWGYQVTGYYSPTSRYGIPEDFMYLVDKCHSTGLGVILDWVPGHFPRDEFGLRMFDGTPMYEYADPRKGEHKDWGTMIFDYGKKEVQSFLISNALYWIDHFHIDGLRVDAVASMLYLDYSRNSGEWIPNKYGRNQNLEVVEFFKKLNTAVFSMHPQSMMIAEESTSWPKVSHPVHDGGLGFNFKWNMGWMNDMLSYIKTDPYFRAGNHNKLTFSFMYAFSENFILPISHDEVVHGKCSLIQKMGGDKIPSIRSFLSYMIAHPGKKLTFMGTEFGQFKEWDYKEGLDWPLIDNFDHHRNLLYFVKELNHFYLAHPELWEIDYSWDGCKMLVPDDNSQNIIIFERTAVNGDTLVCVNNFSAVGREGYRFGNDYGTYTQIFSSNDSGEFANNSPVLAEKIESHGFDYSVSINIPPLTTIFFKKKKLKIPAGKQVLGKPAPIIKPVIDKKAAAAKKSAAKSIATAVSVADKNSAIVKTAGAKKVSSAKTASGTKTKK